MRHIRTVAVLGSGLMGSGIACHLANAGFHVLLLDLADETPGGPRNRQVDSALEKCIRSKPAPLFLPEFRHRIRTGNFTDDLHRIAEADWILEAVIEKADIKQALFEQVEKFRTAGTPVTTNTSGIPIHILARGRSEDFRKHFLGTHFFNPPRYLRLLELIPGPDTDPAVIAWMEDLGDRLLGKQPIRCKDTPAFIANRVGVFSLASVFRLTEELGLAIPVVDKLTGPGLSRPNTGTFRLADLVGHDTGVRVMEGILANCPDDEQAAAFAVPAYMRFLLDNNFLGQKTGQGFYRRSEEKDAKGKPVFLSLNLKSLEYEKPARTDIPALALSKQIENPEKRIRALYESPDAGGQLVRRHLLELFSYAANRIPEISDTLFAIDQALKQGFAWTYGPFEYWDIIGVERGVHDGKALGLKFPDWIDRMLATGQESFYRFEQGKILAYDPGSNTYVRMPGPAQRISLRALQTLPPVYRNDESVLRDIGDGVLCFEFTSKSSTIGEGVVRGLNESLRIAEEEGWKGLVIGHESQHFSVGANLMLIGMMAFQEDWDELETAVRVFQETSMRCRLAAVPVVAATHGYVFGGGCELSMHCDSVAAGAESYIGLVEAGVGLIPGGAGTKEFAVRLSDSFGPGDVQVPRLIERTKTIALGTVSTSAQEAFGLGYLRPGIDPVVMNMSDRITAAKRRVLELSENYVAPRRRQDILVLGRQGLASLYAFANEFRLGRYGSEHDLKIVHKLAWVLCGGDLTGPQRVSEDYLLELEREAFLSLCGESKTLERIQYMLEHKKPLRN